MASLNPGMVLGRLYPTSLLRLEACTPLGSTSHEEADECCERCHALMGTPHAERTNYSLLEFVRLCPIRP